MRLDVAIGDQRTVLRRLQLWETARFVGGTLPVSDCPRLKGLMLCGCFILFKVVYLRGHRPAERTADRLSCTANMPSYTVSEKIVSLAIARRSAAGFIGESSNVELEPLAVFGSFMPRATSARRRRTLRAQQWCSHSSHHICCRIWGRKQRKGGNT